MMIVRKHLCVLLNLLPAPVTMYLGTGTASIDRLCFGIGHEVEIRSGEMGAAGLLNKGQWYVMCTTRAKHGHAYTITDQMLCHTIGCVNLLLPTKNRRFQKAPSTTKASL